MKFLINTLTHWEEPPRARHQVAYALSKKYEVTFIAANKFGLPRINSVSVNNNLTVLKPYFFVGNKIRYRLPIINEIYLLWLFKKLARKYADYEVINFDFTATKIFNFFNDVIYYCNDSFSAISKHINPQIIARYHKKCEAFVVSHAKFCIGVSPKLKDELKKFNPNSFEIALGSPDISKYKIDIQNNPRREKYINISLMGIIRRYNISYKVLNLLLANDNIRLTLIGPVEDKFYDMIEKKEKLIIKGPLLGEMLYKEINESDITIAPYVARLTDDADSGVGTGSKIYHYFALGKPVVISHMAGLDAIHLPDGFIYVAKKEEDFPELIYKAHRENNSELIKQRIEYAKNNTWEKRMERLIEIYEKHEVSK